MMKNVLNNEDLNVKAAKTLIDESKAVSYLPGRWAAATQRLSGEPWRLQKLRITILKLITIYSLIMHVIKGLAHCYHLLIQNTDNKLPNVPGKGVQSVSYQLDLFSAEGMHAKSQCVVWFSSLWVAVVSFVPADLIMWPSLLSYLKVAADMLILNVINHSILIEYNQLFAVSDMFVFSVWFCKCVYISLILLLYVVAVQIESAPLVISMQRFTCQPESKVVATTLFSFSLMQKNTFMLQQYSAVTYTVTIWL